jgi:hypothetical protein
MIAPTIDRSFMRDLKSMDRRLNVKFNGSNFVITYDRGHGEPVNLSCVKADDGSFRQPDRRDLEFLLAGDMERINPKEHLARVAEYMDTVRKRDKVKAKELIRDCTRDDKIQLMRAMSQLYNCGKNNSAFRRIDHKPRRNVVMTA